MQENEAKLNALFEEAGYAMGLAKNGVTLLINKAYLKLFGYEDSSEVIGNPLINDIAPDERPNLFKMVKDRSEGKPLPVSYQTKGIRRDGKIFDMDVKISTYEYNNEIYTIGILRDITDSLVIEKKLRESEAEYRAMYENAMLPIVRVDLATGKSIKVNKAAATFFGYDSTEEATGIPANDHWVNISDREANIQKLYKVKYFDGIEIQFKKKDGTVVWAEANQRLDEENGFIESVWKDITERKLAEKQIEDYRLHLENLVAERTKRLAETNLLLEEEIEKLKIAEEQVRDQLNFFEIIINTVPIPVFIMDLEGKYVNCNPLFAEICRTSRDEILQNSISINQNINNQELHKIKDREVINTGKIVTYELTLFNSEDELRDIIICKAPLEKSDGQIIGIIGIVQDVTENKTLEKNIKKSLETEHELNELKTRFISTTSHEFRTPLTAILSSADLLEIYGRNWPDEKYIKHTSQIRRSVKYMTELLDDILEISRIESGKVTFKPDKVDICKVCLELIDLVKVKASDKHIFHFNYEFTKKEYMLDEKLIRHILTNLLSNAVKYSPEGGKIELNLYTKNNNLIIEIMDEGIGIPVEEMKNLSIPFFRAQNTYHIPGTGLGLSIVKKSVELHGGILYFNNKIEKGAVFSVSIPY